MEKMNLFQVDAFSAEPFKGNPAAVYLLPKPMPDAWMQKLGMEMNLSETAFILPEEDEFRLRWFTPTTEVPLCGHATLASAHVLWEAGILGRDRTARFRTLSGLLTASYRNGWITLDFPIYPVENAMPDRALLAALGIPENEVLGYVTNKRAPIIEVKSEALVRGLKPDFSALGKLAKPDAIVTVKGNAPYDFVSRFFAPGLGIPEDPVTGAAHCALAAYWSGKTGRREFFAYQASARGGEMRVKLVEADRVHLSGEAVTVFRGFLNA